MRDLSTGAEAEAIGAIPIELDVTDQRSVDQTAADLPELDVLINNAGILGGGLDVDDLDAEVLRDVLETNVVGLVRVTQALLPLLRLSSAPVIVNVASGVGFPRRLATPGADEHPVKAVPYASSKAAVIALTVQYAKSLPGMRVNASDPGYTATAFNHHSGHQTVTEGTDATVALAQLPSDGPSGQFFDRNGIIEY